MAKDSSQRLKMAQSGSKIKVAAVEVAAEVMIFFMAINQMAGIWALKLPKFA